MRVKRAWLIASGAILVMVVTAAVIVNSARDPVPLDGTPSGVSAVWQPIRP